MRFHTSLLSLAVASIIFTSGCQRGATDVAQVAGPAVEVEQMPVPAVEALVDVEELVDVDELSEPAVNYAMDHAVSADVVVMSKQRSMPLMAESMPVPRPLPVTAERYAKIEDNAVVRAATSPVSTFSIDVDTAAYANVRRFIEGGQLPPKDAVRIEEMVNYFDYAYALPEADGAPFSVSTELAPSPWHADRYLLRVGLKGYELAAEARSKANLVFLVDVSGSMDQPKKLGLLRSSMKLLVNQMTAEDKFSIVTYAGRSEVVLEPTGVADKAKILVAIDQLRAGGGTNGEGGIKKAYQLAEQHLDKEGVNRVILATDGDFNVGMSHVDQLTALIEKKRETGIALTTLGFGQGNYNDHMMEQIADKGNGNYAYIDTLNEAKKVLVDELSATLQMIAKDVKVQIEFNPAVVAEYRQIGYVNRQLKEQDFNNDRVDAGEIGAGHSVTALYEIALVGSEGVQLPERRYSAEEAKPLDAKSNEIAWLKLRYKAPDASESQLMSQVISRDQLQGELTAASEDYRFAAAVAAFGQKLRGNVTAEVLSYQQIVDLAEQGLGQDRAGYRREFVQLVELAAAMDPSIN